jgi:hypothetical protein
MHGALGMGKYATERFLASVSVLNLEIWINVEG